MKKSKRIKSAEHVEKLESLFSCPICKSRMKVVDLKSLVCTKNHNFDFARQGYLNVMVRPSRTQYDMDLFEARHKMITENNLYNTLHENLTHMIKKHVDTSINDVVIADIGCGEGSHLQKVLDDYGTPGVTGVGLDISKEGIAMAAKQYVAPIWLVGDLANPPFGNQSIHVILNILSPSNYEVFKRILVQNGLIIKVIPGPNYLKELRELLFENTAKEAYENNETESLFNEHFNSIENFTINYTKQLGQSDIQSLVHMTPLSWSADAKKVEEITNRDSLHITIDLRILVGKHHN